MLANPAVANGPRRPGLSAYMGGSSVTDLPRPSGRLGAVAAKAADMNQFLGDVEVRALRMAQVSVRNREDALDIVQDVMLVFVRKYAGKPRAEWRPLFFRILTNRIRDWHRRNAVRESVMIWRKPADSEWDVAEDPVQSMPDRDGNTPHEQARLDAAATRLTMGLEALPGRQREVFMFRIWDGLSVRDTAIAMRCSEGSVKTHLSRALGALKLQLEEFRS